MKSIFKKRNTKWLTVLAAGLASTLIVTSVQAQAQIQAIAASAGIPTANLGEFAQQAQMLLQLKDQVTSLKAQYTALTGNHSFGQILNNPALNSYIPPEWVSVYNQAAAGSLTGVTKSMIKTIQSQEGMANASTPGQQRYNDTLATNKAVTMQAYEASQTRLTNIQNLMQQSNLTQDASAKADLQNRLLAEQAMIQNEQNRLNMMAQLQQQETKLAEEQRSNEFRDAFLGRAK